MQSEIGNLREASVQGMGQVHGYAHARRPTCMHA